MYIFLDTETTGLPDLKQSASWGGQPRICQLGAILTDAAGRVKAEANLLIKPDRWTIPDAASAIHGIRQADAERYGLSIRGVLSILGRFMAMADTLIAHNLKFDLFMLEIEANRTDLSALQFDFPKGCFCTMTGSKRVLKLPPTERMAARGMTEFKSPNLQEAYRHFFGKEFEGAHDAMADVRACKDVFFALRNRESAGAAA